MRVPLNWTVTQQLTAGGNGTATTGPHSAREIWYPTNVHVSTNQSVTNVVNEATCKIYVGDSTIPQNFRDLTYTGSSGDSTDKVGADVLKVGDKIFAVWSGADANVFGVMVITGEKEI